MTIDELDKIVQRDLCISSPEMDVYRKCPHSAIRCDNPLFRKEDDDLLTNAAKKCNSIIRYYEDEYTARAYSVSAYEEGFVILYNKSEEKFYLYVLQEDEQYAWLKEQNTKVMKQAIRQMDGAYQKFFKQHNGFPKFKTKKDKQSALFPYDAISKHNTFETRHISLTTPLKNIKFRCSDLYFNRLQKYNKNIRSATLSKTKSGNFFLSILIEMEDTELKRFERTNKQVGIDLGIKDFVITSDGEVFENKHFFKKEEKQIKKLQRQLSKKVNGSNNRKKVKIHIAKLFERIVNKKNAYIHYITNELLTYFDTIFMENLNVSGMLRNHHFAKTIQEVGFYKFKETLINKALVNDKQVIFVDRFYPSSKTCSVCGYKKQDLILSDRE